MLKRLVAANLLLCALAGWGATAFGQKTDLIVQTGHTAAISSVAISPDGKTLASRSQDKTIKLWDTASGQELQTFKGTSEFFSEVAFSPDGKILASTERGSIKLWDLNAGEELKTLKGDVFSIQRVAFSPDGKMLISHHPFFKKSRLWDIASGKEVRTLGQSHYEIPLLTERQSIV